MGYTLALTTGVENVMLPAVAYSLDIRLNVTLPATLPVTFHQKGIPIPFQ